VKQDFASASVQLLAHVLTVTLTDRGRVITGAVCHCGRVTVAPAPARRRLVIQAAVGLACVAIVVVGLWMVAGLAGSHESATSGDRPVQATVTATASCQGTDTEDAVSFRLDGQTHQAKLDGCGHQRGEVLGVLVPAQFDSATALALSAAAPGDSSGVSHRVAFILLIAATVIGGACGYRFFRTRGQHGDSQPPPAKAVRFRRPRFGARKGHADDDQDDMPDYHTGYHPPVRNHDPEATGVDWFEDSSTHMKPVPPPADLGQRTDRS
jgi:hypothetical protein